MKCDSFRPQKNFSFQTCKSGNKLSSRALYRQEFNDSWKSLFSSAILQKHFHVLIFVERFEWQRFLSTENSRYFVRWDGTQTTQRAKQLLSCITQNHGGGGGGGGALRYKPIRDVPFFRVSFFSINSWKGYENWSEIPKRVMTICSRTNGYCFQE